MALSQLDPAVDPPISITFQDCHAVWSEGFAWSQDYLKGETNLNGYQVGEPRVDGSISVIGGSVTDRCVLLLTKTMRSY